MFKIAETLQINTFYAYFHRKIMFFKSNNFVNLNQKFSTSKKDKIDKIITSIYLIFLSI